MKDKKKEQEAMSPAGGQAAAEAPAAQTPSATAGPASDREPGEPEKKNHARKSSEKKEHPKDPVDERFLRLLADFDNFRKRTVREKTEIYQRAQEDLLREMLPVMDHLDLALSRAATDGMAGPFVEGLKLIAEQMAAALKKFDVQPFEAEGQMFDPERHDAVARVPTPDCPENTVVQQIKRGYRLGEKVIRPAQVIVAAAPAPAAGHAAGPASPASPGGGAAL